MNGGFFKEVCAVLRRVDRAPRAHRSTLRGWLT
jgi:hypothetical protein